MTDSLTPLARRVCDAMSAAFPGPAVGVEALRAATEAGAAARPVRPVADVRDGTADGIPVRVYSPSPAPTTVIVFFHGGGWVLCGLDTHDGLCRELAARTGALVISAGYRRAPEHPFPAAADDAYTVLTWAARNHPRHQLLLAGDSSGGNLAAACSLRARDESGPRITAQLLLYPALDHRLTTASAREFAEGYFHTTACMRWYWQQYAPGRDAGHPYASPGLAPDLSRLPPTLLVLADCDPLRDEGLAYARRTGAEVHLHTGVFHGFLGAVGTLPQADSALAGAAAWVTATTAKAPAPEAARP
ncbi:MULTISPECIES: alpha/beta hydrolase [unclassified Streptomyces]|uniref:alpha/beta hydrolase n=1 Tax=unclassified Streptomyces TaxID=2593676 RepID=UPI002DDA0B07|nr:alpha/beta hydrolase [Streptomyces sp. NBC_01766]WSC24237.1 alpha/beta hydrolase [Streptomyces sp. NBC_01766]WSV58124.1 alpha/beta hydrolase [Streptomyces sp. NBC_01014]